MKNTNQSKIKSEYLYAEVTYTHFYTFVYEYV